MLDPLLVHPHLVVQRFDPVSDLAHLPDQGAGVLAGLLAATDLSEVVLRWCLSCSTSSGCGGGFRPQPELAKIHLQARSRKRA